MANFNMHLNTASIVSGISAATLASMHIIDVKTSFYCFFAGILGGILPDIDHNNSIPVRLIEFIVANLVAFLVVSAYLSKLKLFEILALWVGIIVVFNLLFNLFKKFTIHRGIIHSVPMGILFSLASIVFLYRVIHLSAMSSYYIGMFVFLGYMTHLILDEIYSVDLAGHKLKKSFGSAVKFFSKEKEINILIYLLIILFILLLPNQRLLLNLIKDLFNV